MSEEKKIDYYTPNKKAIQKYQANKDRITIWVAPEQKEKFRARAKAAGQSLTEWILSFLPED